ncbi:ABC transporter substrate-binding protein [Aquamicrobium sp. NLF2-7]|uniref:ABC transporter substrate-binding protein n=1 Tax=Aquamicrobium sp. NLF2-7 TaxID=2918753 RepID=UPI001EFA7B8A|nr:ABC transporter substrate-binding protein [Aquamicrobium sp. NLF2-7]MCG8273248.1 ABC transporter substrate-binding protein [Aquamicrobium sp. NLF2-7]
MTAKTNGIFRTFLLAGAASVAMLAGACGAQAQDLQKVRIGVGGSNFLNLTYYYVLLPGPLGYWKEEGYDVEVFPVSGSAEAAQQLAINNLDFAEMNASAIIQANTEQKLPIQAIITTGTIGWGLSVARDGPIKTVADLKGKSIGVVSLSSGGIPLLNSFLKTNGLDPENDVTLISTGVGAQAISAFNNGQVDALMYWGTATVGFRNAGLELETLSDPAWKGFPDFTFSAGKSVVEKDPAMVEGIARGMAKAMVFAAANPDCARKLQWKHYPDTKPTGMDEDQAAANDLSLISVILSEQAAAAELNGNGQVAGASVPAFGIYQDFLFDAGVLTSKVEPAQLVAGDDAFRERINNFDKAAIEAQAKACDFPG